MTRPDPTPALARWQLRAPQRIARTPMADVYRVEQANGAAAVLKCLTPTGQREEAQSAAALTAWNGSGAVQLIAATADALLLETCDPTPLPRTDSEALPILCEVVAQLHRSETPLPSLPHLRDRCAALTIEAPSNAQPLITRAQSLSTTLLASAPNTQLLHGDLHHDNVLQSPRGWCAIDPQPLMGERAYDLANLFSNPLDRPDVVLAPDRPRRLARHLAGALNLDAQRLLGWGFVHACISACWAIADGDDPTHRLAVAKTIAPSLEPA